MSYNETEVLKIDLKTWNYGGRLSSLGLLNNEGMMCCLGFECALRGICTYDLYFLMPSHISRVFAQQNRETSILKGLALQTGEYHCNTNFSMAAAGINDVLLGNMVMFSSVVPACVENELARITNDTFIFTDESQRREMIAFLFKHYLNRTVEFIS
jgi:hypothetical protein